MQEYSTTLLPRIRAAAVIIRDHRVLLVEHLKEGRRNYLLPGGGVGFGESLHDALRRELWEEARMNIAPGKLLFISESIAPDGERHMVQIAFAAQSEDEPQPGEDPRVSGFRFAGVDEIPRLDMLPATQPLLVEGLRTGFSGAPTYLGNVWRDIGNP